MMTEQEELVLDESLVVTVVRFRESRMMGTEEIENLGQELYALAAKKDPRLLLDFSSVEFLSSAALGKLLSLNAQVNARGGAMVLCRIRPEVAEVFHTCRLDRLFQIRSDRAEAVELWVPLR